MFSKYIEYILLTHFEQYLYILNVLINTGYVDKIVK